MKPLSITITLLTIITFISCGAQDKKHETPNFDLVEPLSENDPMEKEIKYEDTVSAAPFSYPEDRVKIIENLKAKIDSGQFLTVHVFVPLCDNEHQGIVPTSASIGNGFDAPRNLYWGTSKGMKRFFKEKDDWKMIYSNENAEEFVLDRAVFEKTFPNKAKVRMVMDAYRGDKMKLCLEEYFQALAGNKLDSLDLDGITMPAYGNADLLIFNGHNGLMDEDPKTSMNSDSRPKDAVAIACISKSYFKTHWQNTGSYPLVMTTGLMYPGAFCTEYIVNDWAMLKNAEECRAAAGKAYYKYKPKSGPNGSNNLFSTGW